MCTLTIIPIPGKHTTSYRLAFNRDEFRSRCPGLPPRQVRIGPHDAVMPIDPQSGGTWIGGNSAGLVLGLLNKTPLSPPTRLAPPISRGVIIPRLLAHASAWQAASAVTERIAEGFEPFQLFLLDLAGWITVTWDGKALTMQEKTTLSQPIMLTSSNLGDSLVFQLRGALFDAMVASTSSWQVAQDEFHRHQWQGRTELSVCMSSRDAATMSRTVVRLEPSGVVMSYFPGPPDQDTIPAVVALPLL